MLSKKGLLRVTIIVPKQIIIFKMLITPERKVPQRSDTSQNDHTTFASGFLLDFLKSGSTALLPMHRHYQTFH